MLKTLYVFFVLEGKHHPQVPTVVIQMTAGTKVVTKRTKCSLTLHKSDKAFEHCLSSHF